MKARHDDGKENVFRLSDHSRLSQVGGLCRMSCGSHSRDANIREMQTEIEPHHQPHVKSRHAMNRDCEESIELSKDFRLVQPT